MLGVVSAKRYRNTGEYRNLELIQMHKYYDEVLMPRVDDAFAEMKKRWNLTDEVNLDWMMDTRPIEKIN